jgi:hypothetical protein
MINTYDVLERQVITRTDYLQRQTDYKDRLGQTGTSTDQIAQDMDA